MCGLSCVCCVLLLTSGPASLLVGPHVLKTPGTQHEQQQCAQTHSVAGGSNGQCLVRSSPAGSTSSSGRSFSFSRRAAAIFSKRSASSSLTAAVPLLLLSAAVAAAARAGPRGAAATSAAPRRRAAAVRPQVVGTAWQRGGWRVAAEPGRQPRLLACTLAASISMRRRC